jgi:hypothetical protein
MGLDGAGRRGVFAMAVSRLAKPPRHASWTRLAPHAHGRCASKSSLSNFGLQHLDRQQLTVSATPISDRSAAYLESRATAMEHVEHNDG